MKFKFIYTLILGIALSFQIQAQKSNNKKEIKDPLEEISISGLKFRSVGPALTSGRIADIAVNPNNHSEYYVATASGGVWKTTNSGTTFQPIFDSQGSYSIGCVTMDPNNPSTIWVGSGENNNQRSVAYGDGIYKSTDGGQSWNNMGLKESQHIGKIIVHPDNSNKIYVAAIGPLWNSGGDRGVYASEDGGKTWKATLTVDKYTGVTDLVMDPRNPDVLYAAAYQRARHVFTYLGGGPGSGLYKSVDGGMTWDKINNGLPTVEIGRIGLAISPANPDYLYAIVEAAQGKSAFYRSTNGGASWDKRGGHSTSGNYYQEIVCDPVEANTIYSMDTWLSVSHDGGATFKKVGEDYKHVDNHCMWIEPTDNTHWIVGCDGGLYETWDSGSTWDFKPNLPVTQFYKVAVDNDYPFYNIYGGTQDNFSLGGPSRTNTAHGIINSDWFITNGGDGFESQIDPNDPNIVYAQLQHGVLVRYDKKSGERVGIQPKEAKGENAYRWNWDAPLIASPNKSGRVYFAANKVFRSDDYGNSWKTISDDLTGQYNRNELKIMDKVWGIDAVSKNQSTSLYGTIVAMAESTLDENMIVVGTDDGLIQITENGGQSWRKVNNIPGVPNRTYVNAVYTSNHDANVIYAAFNHHKYGDFKPYIFKSSNKGLTWQNITNNLPERGSVYAIEEDHIDPKLLFVGTEFGAFFSPDGGQKWKALKNGLPTVAVRDISIQRRENDLVLATFGRGFYVMDDYSALRSLPLDKNVEPKLFPIREALAFEQAEPLGLPGRSFQGDSYYSADNLGPEAMITYYLKDEITSTKDQRRKAEKELSKENKDQAYPSYQDLLKEKDEIESQVYFTIKDQNGNVVRKLQTKPGIGVQRINWDLRYASKDPISLRNSSFYNPFASKSEGSMVPPGEYTVEMTVNEKGMFKTVGQPMKFGVKALDNRSMPSADPVAKATFQREVEELARSIQGAGSIMEEIKDKLAHIEVAIAQIESPNEDLYREYITIKQKMTSISRRLYGDEIKSILDIDEPPTPASRIGWIVYEQKYTSSDPTATHISSLAIAKEEFAPILKDIQDIVQNDLQKLEEKLEEADAPYTPGRAIRLLHKN